MNSGPRSWIEKSNTIGYIPGKKKNRRQALHDILQQLPVDPTGTIRITMASGEEAVVSADDLCGKQLSNSALARRDSGGPWTATEAAASWLSDGDDLALARHLHENVKFFGELLSHLTEVSSKEQLLLLAQSYGLRWTSTDQLYRRTSWFETLGLAERWGMNRFAVTAAGSALLDEIELASAEQASGASQITDEPDASLAEASSAVTSVIKRLKSQRLERKALIGYIPRGRKAPDRDSDAGSQSPFDAVRTLVDLLGDGASVDEFYRRCENQLGMKKTSANQTLQTMRQMQVFDMVAYNHYGADADVVELLELGAEIDFVRMLHYRYSFIGELLANLSDATPAPHAAKLANEVYGLKQIDNGEIRTRLGFMADAGLVERVDWTRYRVTPLGRLLAAELPLHEPGSSEAPPVGDETSGPAAMRQSLAAVEEISHKLREFASRSDASEEFEMAVREAFDFLGFHAVHLGGSGRTDVVVAAHLPTKDAYRAIVDAKASAGGIITDSAINFDVLKGHQQRHHADYGMVVGPDFTDRVREWAVSREFALLTADDLIGLLKRHATYPLTLSELRMLFDRTSNDLADIEEQYAAAERSVALMTKIIELLYSEALEEDPLLDGHISLENINYALRKELAPRPSTAAVEECLQLLSHELVRGVVRSGQKYKLADSPANIMRRLAGLGNRLGGVALRGNKSEA